MGVLVNRSICSEVCPLAQLGDDQMAELARDWAFSPPAAHEGFQDPRFPALGMMAMHYGSLCRFRSLAGLCDRPEPFVTPAAESHLE